MQNFNLHKVKLFALAEAGIALLGLFLTWTIEKVGGQAMNQMGGGGMGQMGQMGQMQMMNAMPATTQNGFNSWGWLSLVGVIVVVLATLMTGDKTKDYDRNSKNIVLAAFLAIAAGALIYYFRLSSVGKDAAMLYQQQYGISYSASAGIGLWSTLAAGAIGLAWVSGLLNKLNTPPPPSTPAATSGGNPSANPIV